MPTTQQHSCYPISMPWYITNFTLRNLVPQLAYVHPLLSQNTNLLSSNPGTNQIDARLSSRSSSQTRGMINLQVPTQSSSNMECRKVPSSQMPSKHYFHLMVIISHCRTHHPSSQHCKCLRALKMMRKTRVDQTMRISQARLSPGRHEVHNTPPRPHQS